MLILIILCLFLSSVNIILSAIILHKKNSGKMLRTNESLMSIQDNIIEDLVLYCKEKYNMETFMSTENDQVSLAYKKDDKTIPIINLKFPMKNRNTSEYQSTLEYQKEEIDEWRKKNA